MHLRISNRIPRIGGRVWKTGAAIVLSLALSKLFNIPEPLFVAIIAIICVQPTVVKTFTYGVENVLAVILGAIVALGALAVVIHYPNLWVIAFTAGAASIIVMWLCVMLRWFDTLIIAAATVVVIIAQADANIDLLRYAVERAIATGVGVVIATVVNAAVFWHRPEDQFPRRLPMIAGQAFEEFDDTLKAFIHRDLDLVHATLDMWHRHKRSFELAAAELAWFHQSRQIRQLLPFRREQVGPVLSEIYSTIDSIHMMSYRLLQDTKIILEEYGQSTVRDSRINETLERIRLNCEKMQNAIVESLELGDNTSLLNTEYEWAREYDRVFEMHMQYAVTVRATESAPDQCAPLFEVARVGVELRNYVRLLMILRQLLLDNERLLTRLRVPKHVPILSRLWSSR